MIYILQVNRISEIGQGYSDGYVKYAVIKALLKNNFKFDAVTSMSAISNIVHTVSRKVAYVYHKSGCIIFQLLQAALW